MNDSSQDSGQSSKALDVIASQHCIASLAQEAATVRNHMLDLIKGSLKMVPVIGPSLVRLHRKMNHFKSSDYWDRRYRIGGNSGAGSYGRLAKFKAEFLNTFIREHQVSSVIEYGCGDRAQLDLARYPSYLGIDVSTKAVDICRTRFAGDESKRFMQLDGVTPDLVADLSLSLDVIYHLVEDSTFDAYMRLLFESARNFVIVYSSNVEEECSAKHVRHRQFTRWVEQNKPNWHLSLILKNRYPFDPEDPEQTSFADFYVYATNR